MNSSKIDRSMLDNLIYRVNETTQLLFNSGYAIQHLAKYIYDDLVNNEADADYHPINADLRLSILLAISLLGEKLTHESEQLTSDNSQLNKQLQQELSYQANCPIATTLS